MKDGETAPVEKKEKTAADVLAGAASQVAAAMNK